MEVVAAAAEAAAVSEITRTPQRISVRTAMSNSEILNTRQDQRIKGGIMETAELANTKEGEEGVEAVEAVVAVEAAESRVDGIREAEVDSSIIKQTNRSL